MEDLVAKNEEISRKEIRQDIIDFENQLAKEEGAFFGDTNYCPLEHSFTDGIYVRKIFIPAGTYIVGKIHKHEHPNFLMSGTVDVITEDKGVERLVGPLSMISPPGTKRALRAITDLTWITVHHNPSNTKDLNVIEDFVIAEDYEAYNRFRKIQNNIFLKFLTKLRIL